MRRADICGHYQVSSSPLQRQEGRKGEGIQNLASLLVRVKKNTFFFMRKLF